MVLMYGLFTAPIEAVVVSSPHGSVPQEGENETGDLPGKAAGTTGPVVLISSAPETDAGVEPCLEPAEGTSELTVPMRLDALETAMAGMYLAGVNPWATGDCSSGVGHLEWQMQVIQGRVEELGRLLTEMRLDGTLQDQWREEQEV
ncbi:UNVERIFIED_CONTAM: hypothetical protein K2H54_004287 [Gekko kuhli]